MKNALRIVFMGTPEFAVSILDQLIKHSYRVVGVITAPDKPSGRGQQVSESAVKMLFKYMAIVPSHTEVAEEAVVALITMSDLLLNIKRTEFWHIISKNSSKLLNAVVSINTYVTSKNTQDGDTTIKSIFKIFVFVIMKQPMQCCCYVQKQRFFCMIAMVLQLNKF